MAIHAAAIVIGKKQAANAAYTNNGKYLLF